MDDEPTYLMIDDCTCVKMPGNTRDQTFTVVLVVPEDFLKAYVGCATSS